MPQGSILGPLLFITFFDDLADILQYSKIVKYADDTVIYYGDNNINSITEKINNDLIRVSEFFERNELIMNLGKGKTESMVFGTAKRLAKIDQPIEFTFRSQIINFVEQYKYLGTTLSNYLNFSLNFENSYKRAKLCVY